MKKATVYNNEYFSTDRTTAVHTETVDALFPSITNHCLTVYSVGNSLLDVLGSRGHSALETIFNEHDSDVRKDWTLKGDLIVIKVWWYR